MKKTPTPSELPDADLAALFAQDAAQCAEPPDELDRTVQEMARAALAEPSALPHAASQQTAHPTPISIKHSHTWLGAAAVIVLSVGIVPLVLQQPSLDRVNSLERAAGQSPATVEPANITPVGNSTLASEHEAARKEVAKALRQRQELTADSAGTLPPSAPLATQRLPEVSAMEEVATELAEGEAQVSELKILPRETDDPILWAEHIRLLLKEQRFDDARQSLTALRRQHPAYVADIEINQ